MSYAPTALALSPLGQLAAALVILAVAVLAGWLASRSNPSSE